MQNSKTDLTKNTVSDSYLTATGKIRYTITNDYMFNVIFRHTDILAELLCSLLDLKREEITSLEIKNPLLPGNTIKEKAFVLDIRILLNRDSVLDIEMQVNNHGDWPDRSLSYLCRSFDRLYRGEQYASTKSVLHIGILDFNLFPKNPKFYAAYKLMDMENSYIYNDKFELRVLELNHINLATETDRKRGLVRWASLFKATTWKEIRMLASDNPTFDKVAQELYKSNGDEMTIYACQMREEYEFQMKRIGKRIEDAETANEQLKGENASLKGENTSLKGENTSLKGENTSLKGENASLKGENTSLKDENTSLKDKVNMLYQKLAQFEKDS
jgi:predicted transposase/invertase (TIGR01784 family)